MLTQTSELAIKSILFLSLEEGEHPISPRQIAESLQCSPSYLAKTMGKLVRAGILRSTKGSHGGVVLVTQLFFCNLTESDLRRDSPVG